MASGAGVQEEEDHYICQPDEADEIVDYDADITVQSGQESRRKMFPPGRVGYGLSN